MTLDLERPSLRTDADRSEPARRRAHRRPEPRTFRPDIEGMRAIAVLTVVLYHAKLGVPGGYIGVDVFFVISGFLITRQLLGSVGRDGIRALPGFYARRMRRLLPAAATVVITTVVVARFCAPVLSVRPIALDGLFTTFYGLNYRLAVEGTQYMNQGANASPLLHFWSLGVEEQFYLVWPVLILLITAVGRRFARPLLFVVLVALTAISFRFSVEVTRTSAPWAYFSLHTRAWELSLGALVAVAAPQLARLPRVVSASLGWLALVTVVASAFVFTDTTPYPGSLAAIPVGAAAVLIACGCGRRGPAERLLAEPLLQCLGRVSYSWYLWHWPMLVLAPMIVGHPLDWTGRLGIVWLSLAAAVASYFVIENPVRHAFRPNWAGLSLGVVLSGAVVTAAALVITHLPSMTGRGADAHLVTASTATPAYVTQLRKAVADGVATSAVPRNLTPTAAKAKYDLPPADGTNCHAEYAVVDQGPCVYGDPAGTHTAVLVGDSHADMWLPAFAAAGRTEHWRIVDWTKSSCPVASITVFSSALNRTYTECDTWRAKVLARVAALKPDVVFMSDSENVVGADVSPERWSQANLTTLETLRRTTTARVELLQDVPVPAYSMPDCVAQHLDNAQKCTFATDKAYSFPARHRQLAKDAKAAKFPVIDPAPWICTDSRCPAIVGNLLVYRDDTHLTATFSAWLAPMVAPLLTTKG